VTSCESRPIVSMTASTSTGSRPRAPRNRGADRISSVISRASGAETGATWANGSVAGDGDDAFEFGERWTHPLPAGAESSARIAVLLAVDGDARGTVLYDQPNVTARTATAATPVPPAARSPPTADAGGDRTVRGESGRSVALDGTGTTEPDGDRVDYAWTVTDPDGVGSAVALRDADTATPRLAVTANVTDRAHDVTLELEASDPDGATTDTAVVTVGRVERPPVADAGGDRSVRGEAGANVTLDGTNSTDPNGDALSYEWSVVDRDGLSTGEAALVDRTGPRPEFRVGANVSAARTVRVRLNVSDGSRTATDATNVTVTARLPVRAEATTTRGRAPLSVEFVGLAEPRSDEGVVRFDETGVDRYDPGGQDGERGLPASSSVEDGGRTLRLTGNAWRSVGLTYDITDRTALRFDFASPSEGEIHGVGFETDGQQSSGRFFTTYGTQSYGRRDLGYAGAGAFETYDVDLGPAYPDETSRSLVFVNDDDGDGSGVSEFRDVIVYERDDATYEWDWDGDGSYDATGQQPAHTFSEPGTYEVGLRVTAPDGRVGTAERTVVVREPAAPPTANATATPGTVETGESVTLDATGSTDPLGDGLTYDWDVDGDGTFEESGATTTASYDDPGRYVARLRVTDSKGRTATATSPVVVQAGERDPGSDRNGNGVYDDADSRVDAADLDGQYQSDDPLVVPDSVGTINAENAQVRYQVPELVLNATVQSRNQVQIETAGDATIGGTVDTRSNGGYGQIRVVAGGDLDARGATVRSNGQADLRGQLVDLTGATVETTYGQVTLRATDGPLVARDATVTSRATIDLRGDGVDLEGATVNNHDDNGYGSIDVDGDTGSVTLVDATLDSGASATAGANGDIDVADARFRNSASPLRIDGGTVVNESEIAEGRVA